jgi:hypothetical protein
MLRNTFSKAMWVGRAGVLAAGVSVTLALGAGSRAGGAGGKYSHLGEVLVGLALERGASASPASDRGIEGAIARRIEENSDRDFGREEISEYLQGRRWPRAEFLPAFAEAFSLTVKERRLLAWAYTFSESPPTRMEGCPPPVAADGG